MIYLVVFLAIVCVGLFGISVWVLTFRHSASIDGKQFSSFHALNDKEFHAFVEEVYQAGFDDAKSKLIEYLKTSDFMNNMLSKAYESGRDKGFYSAMDIVNGLWSDKDIFDKQ